MFERFRQLVLRAHDFLLSFSVADYLPTKAGRISLLFSVA